MPLFLLTFFSWGLRDTFLACAFHQGFLESFLPNLSDLFMELSTVWDTSCCITCLGSSSGCYHPFFLSRSPGLSRSWLLPEDASHSSHLTRFRSIMANWTFHCFILLSCHMTDPLCCHVMSLLFVFVFFCFLHLKRVTFYGLESSTNYFSWQGNVTAQGKCLTLNLNFSRFWLRNVDLFCYKCWQEYKLCFADFAWSISFIVPVCCWWPVCCHGADE